MKLNSIFVMIFVYMQSVRNKSISYKLLKSELKKVPLFDDKCDSDRCIDKNKLILLLKVRDGINKNLKHNISRQNIDEETREINQIILTVKNGIKNIARQIIDEKARKRKQRKTKRELYEKLKEVIHFIANANIPTINYLYDEVQKIKESNVVKDGLRRMVAYLKTPGNENIKRAIFRYYGLYSQDHAHLKEMKKKSIWDTKVNGLTINVLQDPFNDGVIN